MMYKTRMLCLLLMATFALLTGRVMAQTNPTGRTVTGIVLDSLKAPVEGATVSVKSTTVSVKTGPDGRFSIKVPAGKTTLVITNIGKQAQEINIGNTQTTVQATLRDATAGLDDVVIVGYGRQKKESVVAAVSQTSGATLERAGGVQSIGAALTGNVPGLITSASTGLPGGEDPQLLIRGVSTWNNSEPLVLVDGVERPMNSIDISSVETVTVLKDASATAVFGSRGANGVILITTKRGKLGKASIRGVVNTIMKTPSRLPGKYDSYDGLKIRNQAIENELATNANGWRNFLPEDVLLKYRNPANQTEAERYPNVNWEEVLFNRRAWSNNANINISGGTNFVKYFTSADFLSEGDLFKIYDNNRDYKPGFGFKRLNVRSNLDFQLSKTTLFKTNLSSSFGQRKAPWNFTGSQYGYWIDAYTSAPDLFLPKYADGSWGYYWPNQARAENSARSLAIGGVEYQTTARINTDFTLEQNLDVVTRGLKFSGTISLDNTFVEGGRGVNDLFNSTQLKWINPETGNAEYKEAIDGITGFNFQEGIRWNSAAGSIGAAQRRTFYQLQLNYARTFARKHAVTAMGLMNRNIYANGSVIPQFREDWVFRTTYSFNNKYTVEYNGAYNGSDQFAPQNRFAYFSSGGLNWIISNEKFVQNLKWLSLLKMRFSYGQTGFDNLNARFLYLDQWAYGGSSRLGNNGEAAQLSPYNWYRQTQVGNPNVQWEVSEQYNLGIDFELFKGLITGKADHFRNYRTSVLLTNRADVPSYYGTGAPVANLGAVNSQGYELELHFNKSLNKRLRVWVDVNMTHAQNVIKDAANPQLLPDYQKSQGRPVGQAYSYVNAGIYQTWDQLYGSAVHDANDRQKLPGNFYLVDYNADGIIDTKDNVPYGYTGAPLNTYNANLGFEWKGFSAFVQFYAANNVTRQVVFNSLSGQNTTVYKEGAYWSPSNPNGMPLPRWLTQPAGYYRGNQYMFDGSYVRLKNAEISYSIPATISKRFGLSGLRIYLNGNNLAVWSKMPDDRESNFAGTGWASQGAYPTVKRYNLGANLFF